MSEDEFIKRLRDRAYALEVLKEEIEDYENNPDGTYVELLWVMAKILDAEEWNSHE